jgi:outer membrane protein with beta-barrel domain
MTRTTWMCGLAMVTTAMFASASESSAQVIFGAKVGYTQADMVFEPDTETNRLASFGGGGFLRFGAGSVSFQPEIVVLTKGAVEPVITGDQTLKTDYLELPLLLRLGMRAGAAFAPYLLVGPSISYEIACEAEIEIAGGTETIDCDEEASDRKEFDIGVAGGLGFEFPVGVGSVLVEGRYVHGLTDLNDLDGFSARNRAFAAFLGFAIPLGGVR